MGCRAHRHHFQRYAGIAGRTKGRQWRRRAKPHLTPLLPASRRCSPAVDRASSLPKCSLLLHVLCRLRLPVAVRQRVLQVGAMRRCLLQQQRQQEPLSSWRPLQPMPGSRGEPSSFTQPAAGTWASERSSSGCCARSSHGRQHPPVCLLIVEGQNRTPPLHQPPAAAHHRQPATLHACRLTAHTSQLIDTVSLPHPDLPQAP